MSSNTESAFHDQIARADQKVADLKRDLETLRVSLKIAEHERDAWKAALQLLRTARPEDILEAGRRDTEQTERPDAWAQDLADGIARGFVKLSLDDAKNKTGIVLGTLKQTGPMTTRQLIELMVTQMSRSAAYKAIHDLRLQGKVTPVQGLLHVVELEEPES